MYLGEEISELEVISHAGHALVEYAAKLPDYFEGFTNKGGRWVGDPNYVTFQVHYKRTQKIRISLRGNPSEFQQHDELPLKGGMAGYSECVFDSNEQLFAAASYIRRAWQIYAKGRSRIPSKPVTVGE